MKNTKISSDRPVTLVGGGDLGRDDLEDALRRAPLLVAADGGVAHALEAGHVPSAVIGDLDSLRESDRTQLPQDRIFRISEQETTDFDKALRHVSAPIVLAVGFLGGRLDHQLAALNVLVRYPVRPCILIGPGEIVFHLPSSLTIDLVDGDIVSLFPMGRVTGRSEGLAWPIDGLTLDPTERIGTSNRALGQVRISTDGPGLLAILPRAALDAVMRAIGSSRTSPPGQRLGR